MDFMRVLLLLLDWKGNNYDIRLVIDYWLIKMVYYKVVKIMIDIL